VLGDYICIVEEKGWGGEAVWEVSVRCLVH
jgi:hypothetical protein